MSYSEAVRLAERTWYIPSPANVGLYETDGGVVLIDSGNDKEAGRQIRKILDARGWNLLMIVNTHSNADHCGGNAYLQAQTGCRIAATVIEAAFIENPILEPAFLWAGGPPDELRTKFLEAKPSRVTDRLENEGPIADTPLRAIRLPGHFLDMIGVMTPDGVFFAADSVFGREIVEKYRVTYLCDGPGFLSTLGLLERLEAALFVPSHAEPVTDIRPLTELNRKNILELAAVIADLCGDGVMFEELLGKVCTSFGIPLNHHQYVLIGSTVRSYLSWLKKDGRVKFLFSGTRMLWTKVGPEENPRPKARLPAG